MLINLLGLEGLRGGGETGGNSIFNLISIYFNLLF